MAADNQDQGYVPLYTPKRTAPAAAPAVAAPAAAVGAPNEQGYVPLYQKPGAGQQTGGGQQTTAGGQQTPPAQPSQPWTLNPQTWNVPLPQSVQDWGNVAGNEADMGLPGLKAQADAAAARQRIGPLAAMSADVAGNVMSPTSLLNALPGGPVLAGGAHEGIKSYMSQPNWIPDQQGWKRIGEDTAGGMAAGALGMGAAKAAPVVAPVLSRVAVQGGIPTAAGIVGHQLFGQGHVLPGSLGPYGPRK